MQGRACKDDRRERACQNVEAIDLIGSGVACNWNSLGLLPEFCHYDHQFAYSEFPLTGNQPFCGAHYVQPSVCGSFF